MRKPKAVDDGETHPVQIGVEGATMARRAPFPPSSIVNEAICLKTYIDPRSGMLLLSYDSQCDQIRIGGLLGYNEKLVRISHPSQDSFITPKPFST